MHRRRNSHGSAKSGMGTEEVLEAVVSRISAPKGDPNAPLKALIFDSVFDEYRGAIAYIRVMEGTVREKDKFDFSPRDRNSRRKISVFSDAKERIGSLSAGDVATLLRMLKMCTIRKSAIRLHLSIILPRNRFRVQEAKPMVFSGMYPSNSDDFGELRDALDNWNWTTHRSSSNLNPPLRLVLDSVPDFSDFSIWKSSRAIGTRIQSAPH